MEEEDFTLVVHKKGKKKNRSDKTKKGEINASAGPITLVAEDEYTRVECQGTKKDIQSASKKMSRTFGVPEMWCVF